MSLELKKTTADEIVSLHDFYFDSSEPDAPKFIFKNLSQKDQSAVYRQFPVEKFLSLFKNNELLGFIGFFPDDNLNVNIFYVLSPAQRGKGYFRYLLNLAIAYCRDVFSDFRYIRALTRLQNTASIRGLESCSFVRRAQIVEEVQPGVYYEEYVYRI